VSRYYFSTQPTLLFSFICQICFFFQLNKDTVDTDDRKWTNQIETQRSFYEQQLAELRDQLQLLLKDKNEIEANQAKFHSMSSEYEERYKKKQFEFIYVRCYAQYMHVFSTGVAGNFDWEPLRHRNTVTLWRLRH